MVYQALLNITFSSSISRLIGEIVRGRIFGGPSCHPKGGKENQGVNSNIYPL